MPHVPFYHLLSDTPKSSTQPHITKGVFQCVWIYFSVSIFIEPFRSFPHTFPRATGTQCVPVRPFCWKAKENLHEETAQKGNCCSLGKTPVRIKPTDSQPMAPLCCAAHSSIPNAPPCWRSQVQCESRQRLPQPSARWC